MVTIQQLVDQLPQIDKVADKARRAAEIIRKVDEGTVTLGGATKDDTDLAMTLSNAEKNALLDKYINRAANLLDDVKTKAAGITTV